jgi:hypothetical protein
MLAGIAAVVSYTHMHALAMQHGEGAWASALIPMSCDGMIVASSMSLLLDSGLGGRGGICSGRLTSITLRLLASLAPTGLQAAVTAESGPKKSRMQKRP